MRNTYCLYCSYDVLYRVPGWSVYLISRSARSGFVCVSMIFGQNTLISAPIMVSLTALQRLCRNMRHLHFCLRLYFGSGIQPTVSARCQLIQYMDIQRFKRKSLCLLWNQDPKEKEVHCQTSQHNLCDFCENLTNAILSNTISLMLTNTG